ncbi:acyltransferase family protein [Antarctobacter jejuensis]|uniref:acyltransferase family protein n=1 Tax=Antarctobacter jejuensis TaxID=1439938 RepID=UPI003FD62A3E
MNYRPDIDGLRTIAVLPVVFYHAGIAGVTGGFVGVDIFFVISGFLITTIIHRELAEGRFSVIRFYERRARRILPALFAVIVASLVAGWFLLTPADYDHMGQSIVSALLFVSNMWFWRNSGGYFSGATDYLPMLHTWSLAVEEQFYIFFPLLLMALHRFARRLLLPTILIMVAGSLVLAIWATPRMPSPSFYLLPTRIWELGIGSLLALGLLPAAAPRALREAAGALGLVAMLAPVFLYDSRTEFPGLTALPPVLGAAALIWAGTAGPVLASRLLALRPMVWIGLISYSLYLWHWPIMAFVRNRTFSVEMEPALQVITIAASVLAGWLSWRFVERPFRVPVREGGLTRGRIFALSGIGMAGLGALAGAVALTGGMATQRFSTEQLAAIPPASLRNPYRATCFGARPATEFCTFGNSDPEVPVTWFLWGDSHADALLPALIDMAEREGVKLGFAGHSACGPLPGLGRTDVREQKVRSCLRHNRVVLDHLRQTSAITTVFLDARWALYTDGKYSSSDDGKGEVVLYLDGQPVPKSVDHARNVSLLKEVLERTVTEITAPGRQIVLVGGTPEVRWNVPTRRTAEILFGWPLPLAPSPADVAARQAAANAILDGVAARTGSLHVPLAAPMCDPECVLFDEAEMYYADDDHLSPLGARLLAQPLLEAALAGVSGIRNAEGKIDP